MTPNEVVCPNENRILIKTYLPCPFSVHVLFKFFCYGWLVLTWPSWLWQTPHSWSDRRRPRRPRGSSRPPPRRSASPRGWSSRGGAPPQRWNRSDPCRTRGTPPSAPPPNQCPSSSSPLGSGILGNLWFHSHQHQPHLSCPAAQPRLGFAPVTASRSQVPSS